MSRTKKAKRKKEKIFDLYPEGKFFPMPYKIMKFLIKELEGREQELFYYIARWTYGFRKFGKYQFCFKWHGTTKVAEAIDMNSIVNISKYIKRLKDKHAIIEWKVGFNNRWFAINPAILTGSDRKSKEEEILEIIDVPDYELKINTDGKLFYDEEMEIKTEPSESKGKAEYPEGRAVALPCPSPFCECEFGHVFGVDIDEHNECSACEAYEDCGLQEMQNIRKIA